MGNEIYLPNCCYVCLQKPTNFASLSKREINFKSFQSYSGTTYGGTTTYSVQSYNLPICYSCERKNKFYTIFMIFLAIITPIILLFMPAFITKAIFHIEEGAKIPAILAIIYVIIVLAILILPVILFKLRLTYGLGKTDFLFKSIRFRNKKFSELFKEVNNGKDESYFM
jgi:hypothetical protein